MQNSPECAADRYMIRLSEKLLTKISKLASSSRIAARRRLAVEVLQTKCSS